MPKKGKKGVGKTEEERLLQLQQRAQAEEEMAKKKEEMLMLYLQDKLQKEQKNSAVNLLKLSEVWRSSLRQSRALELRGDVSVLRQTFERQLDELTSVVQKLMRELQEADLQAAQVQRSHLQVMERLWGHQEEHLAALQEQWEKDLEDLESHHRSDREQMQVQTRQQRVRLQDHMLSAEQSSEKKMEEIKNQYESLLMSSVGADEVSVTNPKETEGPEKPQVRSVGPDEMDEQISRKQQQMKTDLRNMTRLTEKITMLKEKIKNGTAEHDALEQRLTAATAILNLKCQELRDQLTGPRRAGRKQLAELSVQGDNTARNLQAVITKGEKLLLAAQTCRKMEDKHAVSSPSSSWRLRGRHSQDVGEFQESLNASLVLRESLRNQGDRLTRENRQLDFLLSQETDLLDGHRAVLVAQRAPTAPRAPAAFRRHTVIEAAHAFRHSL